MTRYLLDANLVLRFLRDDAPKHARQAKSLFAEAAAGRCVLVLSAVVLAECVWVLRSFYEVDNAVVAETLTALIGKPGIEADEAALAVDALRRMAETGIDYADCYLAARAVSQDQPVASFDKDFHRFAEVRRWRPA